MSDSKTSSHYIHDSQNHHRTCRSRSREKYEKRYRERQCDRSKSDRNFKESKDVDDKSYVPRREKNEIGQDRQYQGCQDNDPFDFTKYKYSLNKIFFRDQEFIRRGTREYDDFWVFVSKYQAYQRKRGLPEAGSSKELSDSESKLGIPQHYDKRYRINLSVVNRDVEDFLRKGRLPDAEIDKELTKDRVKEFRNILLHYIDFQQKQKVGLCFSVPL